MTTSYAPELIEPDTEVFAPEPAVAERVTALAERMPAEDVVGADDVLAEIESIGVSDRTARERYGMPSVGSLGDAVLDHLRYGRLAVQGHHGVRRAPSRRRYLLRATLRCALYLGPLGAAVAVAGPLSRVAWPVPTMILLLGWSAAQALTAVGLPLARRAGPAAAARLVAGGFGAVGGLWCALVWIAPAALLGPDRLLAALLGVGGLAVLGTVAGALVTRGEMAVIRWSLPIWLLAAIAAADAWPPRVPPVTPYVLLAVAIAAATARAFRPVRRGHVAPRTPLTVAEMRRGLCYVVIGAGQAACVVLLWRAGPAGVTPPAMLPLLAAVPMLEALVGWHAGQVEAGPDGAGSSPAYARHLRGVTVVTIAGLVPPLAVGLALAVAAYRLPYGLSAQDGPRDLVLCLAGGTLLGGVLAVTLLLAARGRTGTAATLAAAAPLLTAVAHVLPTTAALPMGTDPLPVVVAILAVTHLVGLPAVAHTALEDRRTP